MYALYSRVRGFVRPYFHPVIPLLHHSTNAVMTYIHLNAPGINLLTREDDGEEEKMMNCLSIQREGKTMDLYMKEREEKRNADCQSRSLMPSSSAEPSSSPWGQTRPMRAGEAGGEGETNGGRKLPATCPSPPAANTREATGPNP